MTMTFGVEDLSRHRLINSDKLWPADSGCHQMGSARSSSSMTHPSPKGPLFLLTRWQRAVSLSTYSRWGRTPGKFTVALSVGCSSRSMHRDSRADAVLAAMSTSGAVFSVLSEVWRSRALEWTIVPESISQEHSQISHQAYKVTAEQLIKMFKNRFIFVQTPPQMSPSLWPSYNVHISLFCEESQAQSCLFYTLLLNI